MYLSSESESGSQLLCQPHSADRLATLRRLENSEQRLGTALKILGCADWMLWRSESRETCLGNKRGRENSPEKCRMIEEPGKEIPALPVLPNIPEKGSDCPTPVATQHLTSQGQLTAATGGAELSCSRCTVPFGLVILIAGTVVTAVAYSFNSHGSTISVFGLLLLTSGLLLLISSAVCWKVKQCRKRAKRRESQTALMANRGLVV
ncbi:transmembrane protein 100-like [Carcharodon carcharias]|uniref:transmembrane protein 100-like n=1 Tax=Carcharodon carcharias TaxID=13397 RepID=UPI001B7F1BC5|nr:transmembrane protein 100-like [Carcharodon carcharias]